jgi:putative SOS response-associated peptidase YedK
MCGRYASTRTAADLATLFDAFDDTDDGLRPDYNLAPTDPAPVVRHSSRTGSRVLSLARWGLVPAWSADAKGGARMINARRETVATSPAFAGSFARRRCLVPADGWYEWVRRIGGGQPPSSSRSVAPPSRGTPSRGAARASAQAYFMTRRDGKALALGGIWSAWGSPRQLSFSIVTLPAAGDLALVHDRMPLLVAPQDWQAWLADPGAVLDGPPAAYLATIEMRPVSSKVGDVRNDGPELVEAVPAPPLDWPEPSTVEDTAPTLF